MKHGRSMGNAVSIIRKSLLRAKATPASMENHSQLLPALSVLCYDHVASTSGECRRISVELPGCGCGEFACIARDLDRELMDE